MLAASHVPPCARRSALCQNNAWFTNAQGEFWFTAFANWNN